jgi:hypothetical protein
MEALVRQAFALENPLKRLCGCLTIHRAAGRIREYQVGFGPEVRHIRSLPFDLVPVAVLLNRAKRGNGIARRLFSVLTSTNSKPLSPRCGERFKWRNRRRPT